jgi:tellurite resistance protein
MKADLDANKDLGRELGATDGSKADVAYAIYDGGDTKSKANQMVKRIQLNGDLSEEDRARLLKAHEDAVMGVDAQLADDRRRQEQELDRALKERLERRKAAKKKLNKDEL